MKKKNTSPIVTAVVGVGILIVGALFVFSVPFFHTASYSYVMPTIASTSNTSETSGWQLYASMGESQYIFKYPPQWKVEKNTVSGPSFDIPGDDVGIAVFGPLAGRSTPQQLAAEKITGSAKLVEKQEIRVGNHEAVWTTVERTGGVYADVFIAKVPGKMIITHSWLNGLIISQRTKKATGTINIQFVATDIESFDREKPLFETFLSTFRFGE